MTEQTRRLPYLRPCASTDDPFLYDVFCTTWQSEVAALPNQNLAQHVLRIQHIAQERRFRTRYPAYERYVVVDDLRPTGRLYLQDDGSRIQVVDLTLLPEFRSQGIGSRVFRDLFDLASSDGKSIGLRVGRRNLRATDLCTRLGFRLSAVDDLDNYLDWSPARALRLEETSTRLASAESGVDSR